MRGRTTPQSLLKVAEEFLEAYRKLAATYSRKLKSAQQIHLPHVKHFLLGHSLELGFKAFLLNKGLPLRHLKRKIGHNLNNGLKFLKQQNFNIFDSEEKRSIRLFNRHYRFKDFEYPKDGYIETPYLCKFEKIVEKTLKEAKRIIYRDK